MMQLDGIIEHLEELQKYQEANYEPYAVKENKKAIRALLNIRGFKNLKSFHKSELKMTKYTLELTPEQKELLLYLDNDEFSYNRLQKINKDTIGDNAFYNKWYIEQNSDKIKASWVNYLQFLKNTHSIYEQEIDKLDIIDFESLARYLYIREIKAEQFRYQTGLDALNTMLKVVGDFTK